MFLRVKVFFAVLAVTLGGFSRNFPDDDSFIQMVLGNITAAGEFILPIDNTKLLTADDIVVNDDSVVNDDNVVDAVLGGIATVVEGILPTGNTNPSTDAEAVNDYGTFDFIIVGGGSAGTVLANRLSEIETWKILLLEAGGPLTDFSDIPETVGYLTLSDMNWGYNTTTQENACLGMANQQCAATRGKVLGGSGTVNYKMYVRGNKQDYDKWEEMGNRDWSYVNVLPYFKKSENFQSNNGDSFYHGKGGLLDVDYTEPSIYTSLYLKANQEIGLNTLDYNGENQIGASQIQFTIDGIKNENGGRAFIDPILNRANLNLTLNAFVTKLLIDEQTITVNGVQFSKNGKLYTATASKEVILSAGAYNSPQILLLSGIGPKTVLDTVEINTIVDLPVGQNTQDHVIFIGLNFKTNLTLFNESTPELLEDYLNGHRPFTAPSNLDSQSFINVYNDQEEIPNIQLGLIPPLVTATIAPALFNFNENFTQANLNLNPNTDFQVWIVLLHPTSLGSVTLKSNNPVDFPNIISNYLSTEEDVEVLYKGILKVFEIIDTEPFRSINATYSSILGACEEFTELSQEYWYCAIRHLTMSGYHTVGSTRMGQSVTDSVVNDHLIVHGVQKLRVVDAGVMPNITSGNTNAPTFMIAEKASDLIKQYYNFGL